MNRSLPIVGALLAACAAAGLEGPVSVETHNPAGSPLSPEEASRRTAEFIKRSWPSAAPGDVHEAARGTPAGKV